MISTYNTREPLTISIDSSLPVKFAYIAHRRVGAFESSVNRVGVAFDPESGNITIAFAVVAENGVTPRWIVGQL